MLWPVSDHNAGGPDWNRPGAQHKKLTQDFRSQRPPQTRLVINSELLVLRTPVVPTGVTRVARLTSRCEANRVKQRAVLTVLSSTPPNTPT